MSFNQSRAEKSDGHVRKAGRSGSSGYNRGISSGGGGSAKGAAAPPPSLQSSSSLISSNAPPLSSNRSFKRSGHVEQSRADPSGAPIPVGGRNGPIAAAADAASRPLQNGAHIPTSVLETSVSAPSDKPVDAPRSSRMAPKVPTSNPTSGGFESVAAPSASGEAGWEGLQFGSLNLGMPIPARTSSAPPNLDEQKCDQAGQDPFRAVPTLPKPALPKYHQQETRKDGAFDNQSSSVESRPMQARKDKPAQIPTVPPAPLAKASVLTGPGIPLAMSYQQHPHVQLQFGGPNSQLQMQGVGPGSLQMPPMPVGNASQLAQQMFVPGLQSHPLQPPEIMHQGQGLGFPQMGHQMPHHQMGGMGIPTGPQFVQPQSGKHGVQRSKVKITDPKTHEELNFGKKTDPYSETTASQRSLPGLGTQSQAIPPFASSHQVNYFNPMQTGTFSPPSELMQIYYPSSQSLALTGTQIPAGTQVPRYMIPVNQSGQRLPFLNSSDNPIASGKAGPSMHISPEAVKVEATLSSSAAPSAPVHVSIKPPINKAEAGKPLITSVSKAEVMKSMKVPIEAVTAPNARDQNVVDDLPKSISERSEDIVSSVAPIPAAKMETSPLLVLPVTGAGDSVCAVAGVDARKKEPVQRTNSLKDQQKKSTKKDIRNSQQSYQTTISDASGLMPLSTLKLNNDGTTVDAMTRDPAEISENFLVTSSMYPSISQSLPSSRVEPALPQVEAHEVVEDWAEPLLRVVGLDEEISRKACIVADAPKSSLDKFESGTISSLNEADEIISSETDVLQPQEEHVTGSAVSNLEESQALKIEETDIDINFLQDSNAKVCPTPTSVEKLEGEKTSVSVGEEEFNDVVDSITESDDIEKQVGLSKKEVSNVDVVLTEEEKLYKLSTSTDEISASGSISGAFSSSDSSEGNNTSSYDYVVHENAETDGQDVCSGDLVSAAVSSGTRNDIAVDTPNVNPTSTVPSVQKEKPNFELARTKTAGKKKRLKDILSKADHAVPSDLYGAYKGPEEKLEASISESITSPLSDISKKIPLNIADKGLVLSEEEKLSKSEVEDWEDAAEAPTPKLGTEYVLYANGALRRSDEYGNEVSGKRKYSRDFLLTFQHQFSDLPVGFEIGFDIANALLSSSGATSHMSDREPFPSPGRGGDRSFGGSRGDRRTGGIAEDDRRGKPLGPGNASWLDVGHGAQGLNYRQGQRDNHGVLRNQRVQTAGGILSGPAQSMHSQGGAQRNGVDADRWQRTNSMQRGLIPSPQLPLQAIHKAAKKYEVGKVSDEEEAKQRQLKAILNKLTPQNFEKLFAQVMDVNIDNSRTLTGIISQIFDKALMEPTFCEMYANFCLRLSSELPYFGEDEQKITFKRLLLNKCQEEFERDDREQAEANKAEQEGELQMSEAEREEKRIKARRRMLGNIRLIGELFKKKMLTEKIMHECIKKLLGQYQNPDEEDIEALCKLMSTIGEIIDHPKAKEHMDAYFEMMLILSTNQKLSSRVRFMLKDAIDLRKNKWQQRRKVEGPKKIEEVHRDAAHERQAQVGRSNRGPVVSSLPRRGPPADYGTRGGGSSVLPSPTSQQIGGGGGVRGFGPQARSYGTQDVRLEDRHPLESRTLSMPLHPRSTDDDSITLGPQGGLARGMSMRGLPLISNTSSVVENYFSGDNPRIASGLNGHTSASRNATEKLTGGLYDHSGLLDRNSRILEGNTTPVYHQSLDVKQLSEEALQEKSISAIKEYYSAKDVSELAICIKELNCPSSFYSIMISQWIRDSFERKDVERDLLGKLLVNLSRPRHNLLTQSHLILGFESALSVLEDALADAPRSVEYLGCLFARVVVEDVVPLREIGRMIRDGGEEPGGLLESGLSAEILGGTLESIKMEKGDAYLNEIRAKSELRLEEFFVPGSSCKANKLEAFM